jgi:hypothetical protein
LPIGIGELQPLLTQLPSKDPILFHQIREGLPLLTIQPAVSTASTIWRADASITPGVYIRATNRGLSPSI